MPNSHVEDIKVYDLTKSYGINLWELIVNRQIHVRRQLNRKAKNQAKSDYYYVAVEMGLIAQLSTQTKAGASLEEPHVKAAILSLSTSVGIWAKAFES